jgi:hypothetical protein
MPIHSFTPAHIPAVEAFNRRLASGGADWAFPEDPVPDWLPKTERSTTFLEYFLLTDVEHVRGAYILKHAEASFRGELKRVGAIYGPISEGIVNRAYGLVATQLVRDAMAREPLLFALGLGGEHTPIARLLRAMGWRLSVVPFYFKVLHGSRFLREIHYLRSSRLRACLLDLAAMTGVGWAGAKLVNRVLTRRSPPTDPVRSEATDEFGPWADDLWRSCTAKYSFIGVRDSLALNRVFPPGRAGFIRLKVTVRGSTIGYAVLQDARNHGYERFGNMRVGIIMDCLAQPEYADAVIQQATAMLEHRGVDLVISNHSHPTWGVALRRSGFLAGPTTSVFAASGPLADRIDAVDPERRAVYVNRGDSDSPWGKSLRAGDPAGTRISS